MPFALQMPFGSQFNSYKSVIVHKPSAILKLRHYQDAEGLSFMRQARV